MADVAAHPPFAFWPLAIFSALLIGLETTLTTVAGLNPTPNDAARLALDGLEENARKSELGVVNFGSVDSPDVTALANVADEAKTLAVSADTPADVREQAAAIWLMYRDLSVLQEPPTLQSSVRTPIVGLDDLLPAGARKRTEEPNTTAGKRVDGASGGPAPKTPVATGPPPDESSLGDSPTRSALGDVLQAIALGQEPTRESLDALGSVPMSSWLRSRFASYLRSPGDAFDSTSQHALAEREWFAHLYFVLASIGFPGLAGVVLIVLWPFVRRFFPPPPAPRPLPGHEAWWLGWYPVVVWLSVYLGFGYVLADLGRRVGADAVMLQATVQVTAAWLALVALHRVTGGPILTILQPGIAAFDGKLLRPLLWGVTAYGVAVPVVLVFGYLGSFFPLSDPVTRDVIDALTNPSSRASALVLLVSIVALAPVFEEVIFRGILYRYLRLRLGVRRAAVLSAIVFSLVHANPANALPLFGLGLVLSGVVERSGGILPAIVVHALWNASQVALMSVTAG